MLQYLARTLYSHITLPFIQADIETKELEQQVFPQPKHCHTGAHVHTLTHVGTYTRAHMHALAHARWPRKSFAQHRPISQRTIQPEASVPRVMHMPKGY